MVVGNENYDWEKLEEVSDSDDNLKECFYQAFIQWEEVHVAECLGGTISALHIRSS